MPAASWGPRSLSDLSAASRPPQPREVPVARGMVLEEFETGWVGAVVRLETIGGMRVLSLEDRRGAQDFDACRPADDAGRLPMLDWTLPITRSDLHQHRMCR